MKIGILGHLIKASDLKKGSKLLKVVPDRLLEEVIKNLKGRRGVFVASKFSAFGKVDGYLMAILLTASQVMNLPRELVRKRILDVLVFAQDELGVELIQLGALTKSVTDAGQWIVKQQNPYKGYVNHGDAFTAAITIEAVEKIAEIKEIDLSEIALGIVGAYGTIGEAVSKMLALKCGKAILVGRRMEGFEKLKGYIPTSCVMTTDLKAIKGADIVITVTNHPSALLSSSHLKEGAIVIDVAIPPNVSKEIIKERPDVTRIDGGLVRDAGVNIGFQIGPPKGTMYACVAEVIMQALENERKNYVGSVDLDHLRKTQEWSKKWGFTLAPFTCFGRPIQIEKPMKVTG
jgi:predicted amino acid dehydrogenase